MAVGEEVKQLRNSYTVLLLKKESFIDKAKLTSLTISESAEVELSLAIMTAEIKRLDATIQYLAFGGKCEADQSSAISIYEIVRREYETILWTELAADRARIKLLLEENQSLKGRNYNLLKKINRNANTTTEV